ncbi:hypothetical protein KIW84_045493 [Lathyrus oleraceus]|uniref:DUF8039 domain-containing protein n=1 Tax=Pisum sativum TaxID=3888 RepID=A0A9D5ARU0_PEA|nr:hypothetical protein KIW84_045493 [Pisum sativum]
MADDQHEEVSKKVSAEEEIRRGITVMRRVVQGRSRGIILDVYWNNQGQLIEPNGHTLTSFIGALVRNEIPITCDDWRNKELNESKEKIWSEIKRCFNIEEERRGFCMKLAGKLLRGFQTFLSSKFLKDADGNFVDAELPKKYESLISAEEWEAFKSKRQDPVFQRISATNRERASSPAYPYRKGRVGYERLEQSMLQKEESSETSLPAHVLWKEARVGKSGVPQEEVLHVYQKCEELSQSLSPDDTKGRLSRALDVPEYSGRVRGKGFGVTPTSLSIKKGKAPSNRELHARLEAMQAELDALRREREASASTVYRDASDKNSINCTFEPNIPEGISHCQLYLSSPYYRMVGKGKMHNVSGVLLHTRELPAGCLKVSIDIAVEPNAALPYPSDDSDATTVHEAVGSFVAWPTNLICVGYEDLVKWSCALQVLRLNCGTHLDLIRFIIQPKVSGLSIALILTLQFSIWSGSAGFLAWALWWFGSASARMVLLEISRCCIPKVRIIALCYVMQDLLLGCDLGCNKGSMEGSGTDSKKSMEPKQVGAEYSQLAVRKFKLLLQLSYAFPIIVSLKPNVYGNVTMVRSWCCCKAWLKCAAGLGITAVGAARQMQ